MRSTSGVGVEGHARHKTAAESDGVFDVVGIGFGPANLAFAIAVEESGAPLEMVFLERRARFQWHPGMLLPGTTMQISFLKDLATLRNPHSTFSFVSYLAERGRLVDFVNRATLTPERAEFADYLAWAAARFDAVVDYGREVVEVREADGDAPARFAVRHRGPDGEEHTVWARAVVVARGLEAVLPDWAVDNAGGGRVFHAIELLDRVPDLRRRLGGALDAGRFLVVGGGQSAAEVAAYLHDQGAAVDVVFRGFGLAAVEESPFVNQIFDPAVVDEFQTAPPHVRDDLLRRHANTNYGAVEQALTDDLFARWYRERVSGEHRLRVHRTSEVIACAPADDGLLDVGIRSTITGDERTAPFDAIICATGFRPAGLRGLTGVAPDGAEVRVARSHRAVIDGREIPGLYVQGADLNGHGLATTLLSNAAVRAGEITADLSHELNHPEGP
ncbi:L-lysine N6-monooxygenase MbtG OS=Tsukamurella paurometabola (strain ATCC 8368 / DSM / CCUG 35730 / CIP 100753 / JCM 10117 / KCTC 9821 / NBRC 16120 / NCIMB 702349 / NCTC 13040) OX=521096 GN=Tpau_1749 PE=3 SV=1 [Tsukamurella paurometabola]|uniref:L-lysine N6-monooxygenase MbtG n=1 Tax=Tsukamurella paurometabola (strain ATCC 8368 / DSM 20162 / CCUG 35730 / CIP 100753 / JCM 10117 / KCTC 9821 / NBRC 16120 / NCIMB 702349 / NCTC 13040) TaxID=521096 RepID=D5UM87_TSUPD|nr:SidA/IucD/PvdA family monooxygenase [Tsukamurella paurometabola]ADG78367.1 L-lysine 6-monooxygenase (NADPH) [Tsukamurella paurometabola DSM 20162]SUP31371.1 L-ornithine 5-monooxygenase [Tsukamurella paurometabola]